MDYRVPADHRNLTVSIQPLVVLNAIMPSRQLYTKSLHTQHIKKTVLEERFEKPEEEDTRNKELAKAELATPHRLPCSRHVASKMTVQHSDRGPIELEPCHTRGTVILLPHVAKPPSTDLTEEILAGLDILRSC